MRILPFFSLFVLCSALFEDQIGKFDWRHQFIGCPHDVIFDRSAKAGDRLLVSTKENAFASISTASGNINWRRIQELSPGSTTSYNLPSIKDAKSLYTLSDGGRLIRVWNKATGALRWQKPLSHASLLSHPRMVLNGDSLVVLTDGVISAFSLTGDEQWTATVGKSAWSQLVVSGSEVIHVSIEKNLLTASKVQGGKVSSASVADLKNVNTEKCVISGSHLLCAHSDTLISVNVAATPLNALTKNVGSQITKLVPLDDRHVAVLSSANTLIFSTSTLEQVSKVVGRADAVSSANGQVVVASAGHISATDIASGKSTFKLAIPSMEKNRAPVSALFVESVKNEYEALIVFSDCRTEFVVISPSSALVHSEWQREEGLARISAVEMVDLPLSESQQMIEDEFDEQGGNVLSSFVRRIISQGVQIQKGVVNTITQILSLSNMASMKASSFADVLETVRNSVKTSSDKGLALERDFFNLRKMLVVTSLDGVVFGLDSSDGSIIWRLWLGDRFVPLKSATGEEKFPLFIQRSTAHYQLDGRGAVAFLDSMTKAGLLVVFNPISGKVSERKQLSAAIDRVEMLPFTDAEFVHPLLIIESGDKVSFHPALPADVAKAAAPVFVLKQSANGVSGAQVNLAKGSLDQLWTADLQLTATEKIIAVKGKPITQKVHSQGRVLVDRSVQYKYSNPNMVSIASLNEVNQVLSIFLLDAVTGQIVHSAKMTKALAPVHMVHCENWVVYSYWSEKGRRTEIGVIELYEGEEQSNNDRFDSLSPTKRAPEVTSASYIYPQGIHAMAVSETEQGLTTRSILLALPFGGIHEVTRKLLDANRPLELTQEMREEMMIPYMPEIPIATEDMINYNQTVHGIRGIKTAPSGLESTSLMLAYGMDVFFTRVHPSGTFDILKDDFDHLLISLVLFCLIAGSVVSKKWARSNALKAAWA